MRKHEWEYIFECYSLGKTKVKNCMNLDCHENHNGRCMLRWICIDEKSNCANYLPKSNK